MTLRSAKVDHEDENQQRPNEGMGFSLPQLFMKKYVVLDELCPSDSLGYPRIYHFYRQVRIRVIKRTIDKALFSSPLLPTQQGTQPRKVTFAIKTQRLVQYVG